MSKATGQLVVTQTAAYIKAVFVPEGSTLEVYDDGVFFGSWYGHNNTWRGRCEAMRCAWQWGKVHKVKVRIL